MTNLRLSQRSVKKLFEKLGDDCTRESLASNARCVIAAIFQLVTARRELCRAPAETAVQIET
jgi:hypothetical protein